MKKYKKLIRRHCVNKKKRCLFGVYKNNNKKMSFYYYRDADQKEIDLIMVDGGILHFIECKSGVSFSKRDVSAFNTLRNNTNYKVGTSGIICNTDVIYSIDDDVYAMPIGAI